MGLPGFGSDLAQFPQKRISEFIMPRPLIERSLTALYSVDPSVCCWAGRLHLHVECLDDGLRKSVLAMIGLYLYLLFVVSFASIQLYLLLCQARW